MLGMALGAGLGAVLLCFFWEASLVEAWDAFPGGPAYPHSLVVCLVSVEQLLRMAPFGRVLFLPQGPSTSPPMTTHTCSLLPLIRCQGIELCFCSHK